LVDRLAVDDKVLKVVIVDLGEIKLAGRPLVLLR
jgi:hypothetical protein